MRKMLILIVPFLLSCAASSLSPLSVRPRYVTMVEAGEVPVVQPCVSISSLAVEDVRPDAPIGRRLLEERPSVNQPVTFQGSAEEWVRAGADAIFPKAGVAVGVESSPALRIRVDQIFTEEKVFRRAEFDGRVVLTAELAPDPSANSCWTLRVDGFAENYGYAGNLENYQETLNHALDRALIKLIENQEFQAKVCSKCE